MKNKDFADNNPFHKEEVEDDIQKNSSKKSKSILKGKKKKIKKPKEKKSKDSKKGKKLKGKRERAVSKAVIQHVSEDKVRSSSVRSNLQNAATHKSHQDKQIDTERVKKQTESSIEQSKLSGLKDNTEELVDHGKNEKLGKKKKLLKKDKQLKPNDGKTHKQKDGKAFSPVAPNTEQLKSANNQQHNSFIAQGTKLKTQTTVVRDRGNSRRHRTSSIVVSSRERGKKKRLRLVKKWKRRRKGKNDHNNEEEEIDEVVDENNYNPKPKKDNNNQMEELQKKVDEVKHIVSAEVAEQWVQRCSGLNQLVESTEQLEEFAHSFAVVSKETRLKKETQAKCCGLFSKHRICWYICTCNRGIKNKNKNKNKKPLVQEELPLNSRNSRAFAEGSEDSDNEAYSLQGTSSSGTNPVKVKLRNHAKQTRRTETSGSASYLRVALENERERKSTSSSLLAGIRNSRILQSLNRSSMPIDGEAGRCKVNDGMRGRKSSSTGDLRDLIQRKALISKQTELGVREIAETFENDEMKKRAAELLLLDHENL